MKSKLLTTLTLTSLAATSAAAQPVKPLKDSRPNIILFMVDDMGWQDTSLPFWDRPTPYNQVFETPNMERLARKGMLFTQAYACSLSSASRCSLITGANNARHRVTNWTLKRDQPTDRPSETIILPEWNYNGVSQVTGTPNTFVGTSFVDLLRQHGYHTIHCGKAHWGALGTPGENPTHWGFEVNIAGHAAGGLATYLSERNYGHTRDGKAVSPMAVPGLERYWGTGTFVTEALTREAIHALQKAKAYNQPFYLYMAHYGIHIPIDKDMRFFPKYVRKGLSDKEAAYASLIEGVDKSLGDLMDWLEKNGEADRTIILFMSDNGGLATQPAWRDGPLYTQNAPLKSGKGSLHEGGIREPMIAYWPAVTRAGSRCDHSILIEDFYPTLLEMAGIHSYQTVSPVDGISFVPLLEGKKPTSNDRCLIWNFPNIWGNEGPGINLNCAIRQGDWKLIYHYDTGEKELYHISEDIGETHNLVSQYPARVKRLSKLLGSHLRERGGQRPAFKNTGKPCPWPDEIE